MHESTEVVVQRLLLDIENNDLEDFIETLGYTDADDYYYNLFFKDACKKGRKEFVEYLLKDDRVDPSANNSVALLEAIKNGHLEIVRILLEDGRVDPSVHNNDAIRWTCENGHTEIVKLLLNDGRVDPSVDNNICSLEAIRNRYADILKLLLKDSRVTVNSNLEDCIKIVQSNKHDRYKDVAAVLIVYYTMGQEQYAQLTDDDINGAIKLMQ